MVGFDIRNVSSKDYNAIIKLREGFNYSTIESITEDKNSMIIVAQLNDDIIGYISFTISSNTSSKNDVIVNEIVVEEKYRGLGVGHELTKEAYNYSEYYNAISIIAIYNNYKEEEVGFKIKNYFY